jgi:hypothetical protein
MTGTVTSTSFFVYGMYDRRRRDRPEDRAGSMLRAAEGLTRTPPGCPVRAAVCCFGCGGVQRKDLLGGVA